MKHVFVSLLSLISLQCTLAFTTQVNTAVLITPGFYKKTHTQYITTLNANDDKKSDGVVELADQDDDTEPKVASPAPVPTFLSQGEVDKENLNVDLSDPKQTRVIIYIIASLLPILFLIPFFLSRDLIPMEDLPPVPM